jgi:hypothetical protein
MVTFIDQHRHTYGVESICRMMPIAPSTYFRRKAEQADPAKRSLRAVRDEVLKAIILRIWREHDHAYGAHKVWKQMGREGLREAVPGAAVDAGAGTPGRRPRARLDDHHPAGSDRRATGRPRAAALHRHRAESALGLGLHLGRHVERLRLRGLCH